MPLLPPLLLRLFPLLLLAGGLLMTRLSASAAMLPFSKKSAPATPLEVLVPLQPLHQASPETTPSQPPVEEALGSTEEASFGEGQAKVDIACDRLDYQEAHGVYVAIGNVRVVSQQPNGGELYADKMTFHPDTNIVIAEGNVRLKQGGQEARGLYARFDLTQSHALVTQPSSNLGFVRIRAAEGLMTPPLVHLSKGSLVVNRAQLNTQTGIVSASPQLRFVGGNPSRGSVVALGVTPAITLTQRTMEFLDADADVNTQAIELNDVLAYYRSYGEEAFNDLQASYDDGKTAVGNQFMHTQDITVTQYNDGYQKMALKRPWFTNSSGKKRVPLLDIDASLSQQDHRFEYLGPVMSYNRDLGGFYFQPGWDFKVPKGSLTLAPLFSYGQSIDRTDNTINISKNSEWGAGFYTAYNSDRLSALAARNFNNNYSIAKAKFRVTDMLTLEGTHNAITTTGNLFMQERPKTGVSLTDKRSFPIGYLFNLTSVQSAGVFQDEFFPFNSSTVLTSATSTDPLVRGRLQSQFYVQNNQPLLRIGSLAEIGVLARLSNSYYFDGNYQSVFQIGPTVNMYLGNRAMVQAYYGKGALSGKSPFVFDSYWQGKEILRSNYSVRLNRYARIGVMQMYNLQQANASERLLVQNQAYATFGPKNLKFTLLYDTLFRTVNFGLNYYPSFGSSEIGFDEANIFRPIPALRKPKPKPTPETTSPADASSPPLSPLPLKEAP